MGVSAANPSRGSDEAPMFILAARTQYDPLRARVELETRAATRPRGGAAAPLDGGAGSRIGAEPSNV